VSTIRLGEGYAMKPGLGLARGDLVRADEDLRDWLSVWLQEPSASTWERIEEAAEVYSDAMRVLRDEERSALATP
jgi:hypothetical protein